MTLMEMMDDEAKKLGLIPVRAAGFDPSSDCVFFVYRDPVSLEKAVSVSISGLEELQSSGEDGLRDLVQARVKNARMSLDALQEPA